MQLIRWLVNFIAGAIIAFVGLYFVISLAILFFKLSGQVSDGPMFFDFKTPTYGGLLLFQGISIAIIAACFAVRMTFGKKNDLSFFRRNRRAEKAE